MDINLFAFAVYIYIIIVIITLVYEERDPSTTLAWILVLLLVPVVGIVLYVLFGRDLSKSGARDKRRCEAVRLAEGILAPLRAGYDGALALEGDPLFSGVSRTITQLNGTTPLPCTELEIFSAGDEKFERLLADIEQARSFVHLQYFIWGSDALTGRVCDLLERKIEDGVEVRVLYDWVGSALRSKAQLKRLVRAGARVKPDRADWRQLNYRNHRKTAIIDGTIGYTGGMNMGQEYVDGGSRFETWRDTHIRIEGPVVADLNALLCSRWFRVTLEDLFSARYFPDAGTAIDDDTIWAQLSFSGPESKWEALRHILHVAIARARSSVRIQSPYFVPDQTIGDALSAQALSGVDVRLMMAGVHDKRLPWWAAFSYLDELVAAGGRALHYDAGFMHAKTLTVDGRLAAIGTTNVDMRSFMLHDELHLFFYDQGVAARQDALFDEDAHHCSEITIESLAAISPLARFRNAAARLLSRGM